jgi:hypothetical protein
MTLMEDDLLSALKELLEASQAMTSGRLPTGDEMQRYHQAVEWAERVIKLMEKSA